MNTRQVVTTGITLALGFILGTLAWQPSFAQRKAEEAKAAPGAVGRYRVVATTQAGIPTLIVGDTATGQCWMRAPGQGWSDYGSPVQAKK